MQIHERASDKERAFRFRPPMNNPFIIGLARLFLPVILKQCLGVVAVEVRGDGLERLGALRGQRAILTPNHPSLDPHILFHLSKLLGDDFNYLAAQEVFEKIPSWSAWTVQRLGAYSVIRGTRDTDSFDTTHRLLLEGKRWLVIFPEGLNHWLHDVVMPFREGAARFAFSALDDLGKEGAPPPLYLVPIAIKYVYAADMRREIDLSLSRLEQGLSLHPMPATATCYDRLRRAGEVVLSVNEKKYGVQPRPDAGLNERLQYLKELIVAQVAEKLGVDLPSGQPLHGRMRALYNTIERIAQGEPAASEYERKLQEREQKEARRLARELDRVMEFIALSVSDDDDENVISPESFLDVVGRLEVEVFNRRKTRSPRKVYIQVGEPMNLANDLESYRRDPQATVRETTLALEAKVREMLAGMAGLSAPLSVSAS
jgi:1-acyl-sn-glycerol-3-phosphate acyltransferase